MKKKYIFLSLLLGVMLMGCAQNSGKITSNNSQNTRVDTTVYKQETSNTQTDSKTKKDINVIVNNEIVLESKENKLVKMTVISKGDYSEASDEYFEKIKQNMNDSMNSEVEGLDNNFEINGKTNIIKSTYDFSVFKDEQEKNKLYMSCGLDPENYNEDGTYPLDDLVKTLEDNGYIKQ
ncbi:MAG: hypothetical protein ACLSVX_02170 [Massilimicrobiota timonensis]